jgi:hypothetical protein
MGVTAGKLAKVWTLKLRMGNLSPAGRQFAEQLVSRLDMLDGDELIEIDAAEHRHPIARFIGEYTGQVLAELDSD